MHNLYGKRKLNALEIKGSFTLKNGIFCVWGNPTDEGLSVDIYDDKSKKLLIGLEHGIIANCEGNSELLCSLIEDMSDDLEDSMVYYFGPKESTFEEKDIVRPIPPKTGRFA
jgi:hypothetical protein